MSDKVKLARYRNTSYFVGYTGDGGLKQFTWSGSKNGKALIKVNQLLLMKMTQQNKSKNQLLMRKHTRTTLTQKKKFQR